MSHNAADLGYAPWNDWRAADYLDKYYAEIMPDEQHALSFLCEWVERLGQVTVALDYGCGPTIHHAVALVPKAREIYLADYLQGNLDEARTWLDGAEDAHDWSAFTRHILQLEGNTTHYCAEGATNCKETWRLYMPNLARLVVNGDPSVEYMYEPWGGYPATGANTVSHWHRKYLRSVQVVSPA